ncbi:TPA: DNA mismatch repair endonuclease MutL [Candidatus Dependentiae bacterium]|nr:MAG: mismatch repair protein MutL protein [candidate division TM6 bacterium GW2011_GWE2_31_21]KKP53482.1 MAG: mismatch repair protein MutL protein [candidate division TM6 bacterium GW2011_GWF2_33_332]HBS48276.1 DNA mismatch repair endonuclease MutL [Candidatus Dependentiae bacterium]HBZ73703.1 DNA mismatch repair endonuclease MutL [Candidatus Dependentiae bacterium]
MNKIKVLPPQEALKIAAGEVVERPSSVIKELIENSLDAKSSVISIYIEDAGKKLIRIVDDGFGMSPQDAKICFLPHATSKITTVEDLNYLQSFGFRGEALAAISSVSKVTLTTRLKESQFPAIKLQYFEGTFKEEQEVAAADGTDLEICDLFYNTPARKKFLKQDETEWNQILNNFYAFSLSNIDVHFKLFRDGALQFNLPVVSDFKSRVAQIFGNNFAENLIDLNPKEIRDISFRGLISNHNFWRYNRSQIFFFVNGRYVKNSALGKALIKGYLNVLPQGRFPVGFIFINLENSSVDVNVHPRKEEVQFSKPQVVENLIFEGVRNSLENYVSSKISQSQNSLSQSESFTLKDNFINAENLTKEKIADFDKASKDKIFEKLNIYSSFERSFPKTESNANESSAVIFEENKLEIVKENMQQNKIDSVQKNVHNNFKIIGQLLDTYILLQQDENLVIVDQHAAHERILYEQFSKYFDLKDGIRLLFPEVISLSELQLELILKEANFLLEQGIEIEQIGKNQIAIKSAPPKVQSQSLKELILEIVSFIEENENLEKDLFYKKLNERVKSQMACKAAIKAGDKLSFEEMRNLLSQLQICPNRIICVHGRPTTWVINKNELEKNFKRRK